MIVFNNIAFIFFFFILISFLYTNIKLLVCNARLDDIILFGIDRHYLIGTCFGIVCCRARMDIIPFGFLQNTVIFFI
jgi:hypothetical protein